MLSSCRIKECLILSRVKLSLSSTLFFLEYLMGEVGEEETRRGWYGFLPGLDRKTLLVVLKMVWETKWGVGLEDLEVLGAEGLSIEAFSSWASMAVVVVILLA